MGPSCATRQALPPSSTGRKPVATALASMVSGRPASSAISSSAATTAAAPSTAAAAAPAFMASRALRSVRAGVALAHGVAAVRAGVVHAEGREDVEDGGVDARLEVLQRLAVGQRRAVRVLRERRRERRVGLELLPGAALVVAEGDLAQAGVEDDLRRRVRHLGVAPRGDDVLGGRAGPRQVARVDGHGAERREPLGGRSRLVLAQRRERVVALPHQRAADVARGLAVADEIQLHVTSSVVVGVIRSPGRRWRSR